ncbi:MAG: AraC family transcriptional regulator [Bacteroidia bacterium]|nr:AraC family transcriptional regulator [Bacteroidia bacterium]
MPHELHIKNMVCDRCLRSVRTILRDQCVQVQELTLGHAIVDALPPNSLALEQALNAQGFALLEDRKARLVEQVKQALLRLIRTDGLPDAGWKLSEFVAQAMAKDYASVSAQFREQENTTLEKWFIHQKIEYVKELLAYNEAPIKEIAYRLGYSSVAHLGNQFRQVTGFTPAEFRALKAHPRTPLDQVR